jgi:hypothetical protein
MWANMVGHCGPSLGWSVCTPSLCQSDVLPMWWEPHICQGFAKVPDATTAVLCAAPAVLQRCSMPVRACSPGTPHAMSWVQNLQHSHSLDAAQLQRGTLTSCGVCLVW